MIGKVKELRTAHLKRWLGTPRTCAFCGWRDGAHLALTEDGEFPVCEKCVAPVKAKET